MKNRRWVYKYSTMTYTLLPHNLSHHEFYHKAHVNYLILIVNKYFSVSLNNQ